MKYLILTLFLAAIHFPIASILAQPNTIQDDFEGNGTINSWVGDDCGINPVLPNPFQEEMNPSATVLEYHDTGGQFANIRFDIEGYFELTSDHTFSFKIYVPSNGLTGNAPNQVSLKLQNGDLNEPWSTQSEIIKPIALDEWQIVSFNFETDNYINLNGDSPPPTQRFDFNRVLIQINGENNNSQVLAYIDDFYYDGVIPIEPAFENLVWADEFDVDGALNSSNWHHQTQLPQGGSWFNGEIQHYTDRQDNSFVENGLLKIVAKKETFTDQGYTKDYTSARLNSKFAFQYGRVDVRAKLPSGVGTWPAIWMLGKNINEDGAYWDLQGFGTTSWPACGEIDIMEHWGDNQNYVQSATHTPSSFGATINHGGQTITTASSDFHVYTLIWTEEKLIFSVDDAVHYVYNPPVKNADTWPFDAEQYLLLNIAIQPIIDPVFSESAMEVDYVRVYQDNTTTTSQIIRPQSPAYYPNPTDDELNIYLKNAVQQPIPLEVLSIDGMLIRSQEVIASEGKITLKNLEALSKGIYLVRFKIDKENYCIKFIKN